MQYIFFIDVLYVFKRYSFDNGRRRRKKKKKKTDKQKGKRMSVNKCWSSVEIFFLLCSEYIRALEIFIYVYKIRTECAWILKIGNRTTYVRI